MKEDDKFEIENDVISKPKSPLKWVILLLASLSLVKKQKNCLKYFINLF